MKTALLLLFCSVLASASYRKDVQNLMAFHESIVQIYKSHPQKLKNFEARLQKLKPQMESDFQVLAVCDLIFLLFHSQLHQLREPIRRLPA